MSWRGNSMYRTRCQAVTSFAFKMETERAQKPPRTVRFTYAHTSSIGFNSGAYGGKNTNDSASDHHERLYRLRTVNARVIQHDYDLPLNVAQEMLEEKGDVPLRMAPDFVCWKKRPSDVIAPIVDSFSQFAGKVTRGVTPSSPRPSPHALTRGQGHHPVDEGRALSNLFFPTLAPPVPPGCDPEFIALAARPSGIWGVKPNCRRILRTWSGWYHTSKCRPITSVTRLVLHVGSGNPWWTAPSRRRVRTCPTAWR